MLPSAARLHDRPEFTEVLAHGGRAGRSTLVVHVLAAPGAVSGDAPAPPGPPVRFGFIVSKAVGGSVVRHRVTRRLRHLCADLSRTGALPTGARVVVRATPAAASAPFDVLRRDLTGAAASALTRRPRRTAGTRP